MDNKDEGKDPGITYNIDRIRQDGEGLSGMEVIPMDMKKVSSIRISLSEKNDVWTVSCPELRLSATCDSICYAVHNLYRQIDRAGALDRPVREIVSGPQVRMVFSFRDDDP